MIILTEFGNFGSFKDLEIFMRLENKDSVKIESADYWGLECIIQKNGIILSKAEIEQIIKGGEKDESANFY